MQKQVKIDERDFFKEPFTRGEIENLLRGKSASAMFSFRSPGFRKLGLDQEKLKDDDLIKLMLREPRLIRRPIVKTGKDVYFGADVKVLTEILSGRKEI